LAEGPYLESTYSFAEAVHHRIGY